MGRTEEAQELKSEVSFSDVKDHWAAGFVEMLYREGITKGFPGGQFMPNAIISLEHVKIMLARLLRIDAGGDVNVALKHAGVETEVPCTTESTAMRGQVFLLLDQALAVPFYARFQQR